MEKFIMHPIGRIENKGDECCIVLEKRYAEGLKGLKDFSHVQVFWWFDKCDNSACRENLVEQKPYRNSPQELGVFATRSPLRPNPIAVTTAGITFIDESNGIVGIGFIDADDGTPVLDLKPYTPSLDRIENPSVPQWCSEWPKSLEESAVFDWSSVFNF